MIKFEEFENFSFSYDDSFKDDIITHSPPINMPSTNSRTNITDYNESDLRESNFLRRMQKLQYSDPKKEISCDEIEYKALPVNPNKKLEKSAVKLKLKSLSKIDQNIRNRINNRRAFKNQIYKDTKNNIVGEDVKDDFYINCEVW